MFCIVTDVGETYARFHLTPKNLNAINKNIFKSAIKYFQQNKLYTLFPKKWDVCILCTRVYINDSFDNFLIKKINSNEWFFISSDGVLVAEENNLHEFIHLIFEGDETHGV